MIKEEFQQELKEKITAGVKPSDIKKLKKSKSADDIPSAPPLPLVNEQLKEKQKEVENLREQLETKNTKLAEVTEQLDNSLLARYEAVKQFGLIYDKLQLVKQELDENVDQASEELITADDKVSNLRTKLLTANRQINSLQKDLKLAQRLVKLKEFSLPERSNSLNY
jgi:predicted nuclease with TOPRIM domain